MNLSAAAVLGASALFLGLALLALMGGARRARLVLAWTAMAGFAGLALLSFWQGILLRQSASPEYYDLPASPPGPHRVTLSRPGASPGYRARLVTRSDRRFEQDRLGKLEASGWRVMTCEHLVMSRFTFDPEGVMEFESEMPEVVLEYEVAAETGPLLENTVLEVTCPTSFRAAIGPGLAVIKLRMAFFLAGLLVSAWGASSQRRRLRAQKVTAPAPSTSGPPAP